MSPPSLQHRDADGESTDTDRPPAGTVPTDALVIRNYDGRTSHEITVRFVDADDAIALERTYTLSPGDVVSVAARVERGVYRVEAHTEAGEFVGTDCLVGTGSAETALVEVGNGLVSVSEGLI